MSAHIIDALLSATPIGVLTILAYHAPAILQHAPATLDRLAVLVSKVTALIRVLKS